MPGEHPPLPALFAHCQAVYKAMQKEANGDRYVGHLTKLFANLNLPVPYYTKITQKLRAMDCIRQIKRGGGGSPSEWQLMKSPTAEDFLATDDRLPAHTEGRNKPTPVNVLSQRVEDLKEYTDHQKAEILDLLIGMQKQYDAQEERLASLEEVVDELQQTMKTWIGTQKGALSG